MTSNLTIPEKPGCYFHKNKEGEIIYIGKAKNLKKRIAQYVIKKDNTDKTNLLIQNIATTEFIITTTEYEALLLENNLIKQHSPKYNINLKDDKRYAYLTLTHETFPRLITSRRRTEEGTYFGPFVSGEARNYIYNFVNKTFKLRTCKKLPKKVCLRYHLGICTAPCVGNVSEEDYEKQIQSASEVLKGNTTKIIQDLRKDMKGFSENMQFEEALEIRKQIEALEYLDSRQNVEREKKFDEDIIAFKKKQGDIYGIVFNIHKGILVNKKEFEFSDSPDFF
ncbi:MAG: excinuclease ABC subunit UvrC, partial [Candidatus Woesearchaeota archaeon]